MEQWVRDQFQVVHVGLDVEVLRVRASILGKGLNDKADPVGVESDPLVGESDRAVNVLVWVDDVPEELKVEDSQGIPEP